MGCIGMNNPGRMRQRIRIYKHGESRDEWGELQEGLEQVAEVFADIKPVTGREITRNGATITELTHRIFIRYNPSVKPDMLVGYMGRRLRIEHINDVNMRHNFMELICKEDHDYGLQD